MESQNCPLVNETKDYTLRNPSSEILSTQLFSSRHVRAIASDVRLARFAALLGSINPARKAREQKF